MRLNNTMPPRLHRRLRHRRYRSLRRTTTSPIHCLTANTTEFGRPATIPTEELKSAKRSKPGAVPNHGSVEGMREEKVRFTYP